LDLGLAGKSAITCAPCRGLRRACAQTPLEEGAIGLYQRRNRDWLEAVAAGQAAVGGKVVAVLRKRARRAKIRGVAAAPLGYHASNRSNFRPDDAAAGNELMMRRFRRHL
jgi:hypothetical protein